MNCEICGKEIFERHRRVIIEGSKLVVCGKCSEFGETTWKGTIETSNIGEANKLMPLLRMAKNRLRSKNTSKNLEDYDIIEDFADSIQKGRRKMGISQEELAKLLKERLSVIQKIESDKISPSIKLSREIERVLKIELLTTQESTKKLDTKGDVGSELTIGDIFQYKK